MKKKCSLLLIIFTIALCFPIVKVFAEPDSNELTEINITGSLPTESLIEGNLPSFTVSTDTANVQIEAYGNNTKWAKLENPNGGSWSDLGETPSAEDGPFYAMKLAVTVINGYVLTENTKIIYNGRDMYDTFSTITTYDGGGYVYVDLGQIQKELGPAIEGNKVNRVELDIDLPRVGDKIELINTDTEYFQTKVDVHLPQGVPYYLNNNENEDYMYIMDAEKGELFSGTIEQGKRYSVVIWLLLDENYNFSDSLDILINGEHINSFNLESSHRLGVEYEFEPESPKVTYTIESADGSAIAIFKFSEGKQFTLNIVDILAYTPEQIEEMFDIPAEQIKEIVNKVKNNVKEYGELLNLYSIEISEQQFNYSDKVTLRIKMSDAMKKYNSFKFIFLDENNEFKIQEVHDVEIDGDYLVVKLDHLSAYALVGTNISNKNPATGDKIILYVSMLLLSITGLAGVGIYTKNNYFQK